MSKEQRARGVTFDKAAGRYLLRYGKKFMASFDTLEDANAAAAEMWAKLPAPKPNGRPRNQLQSKLQMEVPEIEAAQTAKRDENRMPLAAAFMAAMLKRDKVNADAAINHLADVAVRAADALLDRVKQEKAK